MPGLGLCVLYILSLGFHTTVQAVFYCHFVDDTTEYVVVKTARDHLARAFCGSMLISLGRVIFFIGKDMKTKVVYGDWKLSVG